MSDGVTDYLSLATQETRELGDNQYIQTAYNNDTDTFSVLYRGNGRYSEPVELTHGLQNERDALQILVAAEEHGFQKLKDILNGKQVNDL